MKYIIFLSILSCYFKNPKLANHFMLSKIYQPTSAQKILILLQNNHHDITKILLKVALSTKTHFKLLCMCVH
jgi:hypothetical protein